MILGGTAVWKGSRSMLPVSDIALRHNGYCSVLVFFVTTRLSQIAAPKLIFSIVFLWSNFWSKPCRNFADRWVVSVGGKLQMGHVSGVRGDNASVVMVCWNASLWGNPLVRKPQDAGEPPARAGEDQERQRCFVVPHSLSFVNRKTCHVRQDVSGARVSNRSRLDVGIPTSYTPRGWGCSFD